MRREKTKRVSEIIERKRAKKSREVEKKRTSPLRGNLRFRLHVLAGALFAGGSVTAPAAAATLFARDAALVVRVIFDPLGMPAASDCLRGPGSVS